jgi:hypothetical protein
MLDHGNLDHGNKGCSGFAFQVFAPVRTGRSELGSTLLENADTTSCGEADGH